MSRTLSFLLLLLAVLHLDAFLLPSPRIQTQTHTQTHTRLYAIFDDVNTALKQAMKDKDKEKLSALRNIKSAFGTALKEECAAETLPDEKAITILRKLQKQRQESITMFIQGNRDDMVQAEQAELLILEAYLPQLADEATTRKWVEAAVAEAMATSKKDMGKVMGVMMKKHKGETDNKLVSKIVGELLQ